MGGCCDEGRDHAALVFPSSATRRSGTYRLPPFSDMTSFPWPCVFSPCSYQNHQKQATTSKQNEAAETFFWALWSFIIRELLSLSLRVLQVPYQYNICAYNVPRNLKLYVLQIFLSFCCLFFRMIAFSPTTLRCFLTVCINFVGSQKKAFALCKLAGRS